MRYSSIQNPEFVLASVGGGWPPAPQPEPPPVPLTWHLPVALALCALSIFLLLQGAAFLRWATKGEDGAPSPRAGIKLAWGIVATILLFFFVNSVTLHRITTTYNIDDLGGWIFAFLYGLATFPFKEPEVFSQVLLFSSLPVGALAAFKFVIAASFIRSADAAPSALTRSPFALLSAALFTLLQLVGSIASIMALFP